MIVVGPSSVATSPPVMPNLPRLCLYDLLGYRVRDLSIVLCVRSPLFRYSLSALSSHNVINVPK